MTLKSEVFSLCKKIIGSQFRQSVFDLIKNLHKANPESSSPNPDRGQFGYHAKQHRLQFVGYLLIDQKISEIEKALKLKIPPLSCEEKILLQKCQALIEAIIFKSTEEIVKKFPNMLLAFDPYCQYKPQKETIGFHEIVSEQDILSVVNSFKELRQYKEFIAYPDEIGKDVPKEHFLGASVTFLRDIKKAGVNDSPREMVEMVFSTPSGTPQQFFQNLIFNIVSLRTILESMSQLIFQAFTRDKLIVLNENNIYEIKGPSCHLCGEGYIVFVQPIADEIMVSVGDIILLAVEDQRINTTCVVEGHTLSFSKDSGVSQEYRLRKVDDDLNCFSNLRNKN